MQGIDKAKKITDSPDQSKRRTLQRLAVGAVAAPLVTSVAMQGLTISKVHAGTAASSAIVNDGKNDGHKNDGRNDGKNDGHKNDGFNDGKNGGGTGWPWF
jgi:hypothetical protein